MTLEGLKMKKKAGKVPFFPKEPSKALVFQTNMRE